MRKEGLWGDSIFYLVVDPYLDPFLIDSVTLVEEKVSDNVDIRPEDLIPGRRIEKKSFVTHIFAIYSS